VFQASWGACLELWWLMLWLVITVAGTGILFGLWLRVPSLVAISAALVPIPVLLITLKQWALLEAIAFLFLLLTLLQIGYLIGLVLSYAWTRVAPRHNSSRVSSGRR
jgi:hypothetical protein